jgi:hypothetical protein
MHYLSPFAFRRPRVCAACLHPCCHVSCVMCQRASSVAPWLDGLCGREGVGTRLHAPGCTCMCPEGLCCTAAPGVGGSGCDSPGLSVTPSSNSFNKSSTRHAELGLVAIRCATRHAGARAQPPLDLAGPPACVPPACSRPPTTPNAPPPSRWGQGDQSQRHDRPSRTLDRSTPAPCTLHPSCPRQRGVRWGMGRKRELPLGVIAHQTMRLHAQRMWGRER